MRTSNYRLFVALCVCFASMACSGKESANEPSQAATENKKTDTNSPRRPPRPSFSTRTVSVGGRSIRVEVADDDYERAHGLMFVESMPEDSGMLFVFENEQPLSFWMKNTLIPLSIAYIDEKGQIVDIQEMIPASDLELSPRTYPSARPAKYALEMNKGWFARNKVKVGSIIKL